MNMQSQNIRKESTAAVILVRWKWTLLRGLAALALGVAAILFPFLTLFALTFAFALFALADGILSFATGAGARPRCGDARWPHFLRGVIGIVLGLAFLAFPLVATAAYAIAALAFISAWAIFTGALEISAAIRLRRKIEGEWMFIGSGAVSILLGIAIPVAVVADPFGFVALAWIVGIYALAAGAMLVMQGLRLRWIDRLGRSEGEAVEPLRREGAGSVDRNPTVPRERASL